MMKIMSLVHSERSVNTGDAYGDSHARHGRP